jgi:predicted ATPase/DNA-binding CsgD family transcriptional regulator
MAHNLVLPRSPLLGRSDTLSLVQQMLLREDVALLTLTGPGGIGKTRLALQAAANLLDHFVDGVYFVALAAIVEPALVLPAVAQALGARPDRAQPVQAALEEYLRDRQLLLVLDNFEQVLPAAGPIAELLHARARLKVLVTSRAPLHLYGEHEFAVPPLALPDARDLEQFAPGALIPTAVDAVTGLRHYAAVDLFCRRAAAVQPSFALTPANALAVAQICIGLDGLPLAIELAAARLKLFGPAALAERLQQRLALLTGGAQDLPPRQRTLRDEIAWSYRLLRPEEQLLFRRLGVFCGGFTLAAAQAVGNLDGETQPRVPLDVLDGLATLVDQSLLRQWEQARGEPRLGMLETIREYALEQLEDSGEAELVRGCHARHFLAFAETMSHELDAAAAKQWVCTRLHADFENMRAAIAWCAAGQSGAPGDRDSAAYPPKPAIDPAELALRLAGALAWFALSGERLHDVAGLLESALQLGGGANRVRAQALWAAGTVAMFSGSYAAARAHLAASCDLYRAAGDRHGLALALREACAAAFAQRDLSAAQQYGEECIALFRAAGDQGDLALAYDNLGGTFAAQGNYAAARAAYEEEHAISQALGYRSTLGLASMGRGWVAGLRGDYAAALGFLEQAVPIFRELNESWTLAQALLLTGEVARCSGDRLRAGRCYRESVTLAHQVGDRAATALVLQQIGTLACDQGHNGLGHCEDAARLLAAAEAHHIAGGSMAYTLAGPAERSHTIARTRMRLGEELFPACWAQGQAMALPQAVALAAAVAVSVAESVAESRAEQAPAAAAPGTNMLPAVQLPGDPNQLTAREREVLRLLVQGLTYAEIADELVISPRTVNAHLTTIYGKLAVNSRQQAVRVAREHRLLDAR